METKSSTIYWAFKLSDSDKEKLLMHFPAIHENIYAEHSTIAFKPPRSIEEIIEKFIGKKFNLRIIGYGADNKGQAVVIDNDGSPKGLGNNIQHITISCANGTRPAYSNDLLNKQWTPVSGITLIGTVARYTTNGWDFGP